MSDAVMRKFTKSVSHLGIRRSELDASVQESALQLERLRTANVWRELGRKDD
jgi:hypothetical protein